MADNILQFWTYHPSTINVGAPDLYIDPTLGRYWKDEKPLGIRYRHSLTRLWDLLGTDQFLWSVKADGKFRRLAPEQDLWEWELNVPESLVIARYRETVWEGIIYERDDDWANLILPTDAEEANRIGAFVRTPLAIGMAIRHEIRVTTPRTTWLRRSMYT